MVKFVRVLYDDDTSSVDSFTSELSSLSIFSPLSSLSSLQALPDRQVAAYANTYGVFDIFFNRQRHPYLDIIFVLIIIVSIIFFIIMSF